MRKRLAIIAAAAFLGLSTLGFDASSALAANAPDGCTKDRGTINCPTTETVGNAPTSSKAQTTTTTASKKGSVSSSQEEQKACTGVPRGQCK